jgi:1,4-alpha-glucan branching enzyme
MKLPLVVYTTLLALIILTQSAFAAPNPELAIYESTRMLGLSTSTSRVDRSHGWVAVARDGQGQAVKARLQILVDNPGLNGHIQAIGPFNNWGKNLRPSDAFRPVDGRPEMFFADVDGIRHGMHYLLMIDGRAMIDPAASMYTTPEFLDREGRLGEGDYLNSVFWDFERPGAYRVQTPGVDLRNKPVLISEIEASSLVHNWTNAQGQRGPRMKADTYGFIATSGVIAFLRQSGINAVEFLPFNQAVDGDSWHFRYQVYGVFAPDSRFGSPDEFKMMIDEFHRNGIAVVMDTVISHFPFKGNQSPSRQLEGVGLDAWVKGDGRKLYAGVVSPWGTYRFDYANPFVRRMLTESILYMMKEYGIDGVRYDNVDGIGYEPGGEQLLKEINTKIREINPAALLVAESFGTPNRYQFRLDQGGVGMNTKNSGSTFDFWKNTLQAPTEAVNMPALAASINQLWDWQELAQMRYITNHDESANPRGGATGSYPASLLGDNAYYVMGKIKMSDAFNMMAGAYALSTPQTRIMQRGSFYTNPSIEWDLLRNDQSARGLWGFFGALGGYLESKASYFNFASLHRQIENHIDNDNKIISLKRVDPNTGRAIYVLINMGHKEIRHYRFGITQEGRYKVAFDSDRREFGGSGHLQDELPGGVFDNDSQGEHSKPRSLIVPVVAPYSVTIFELL